MKAPPSFKVNVAFRPQAKYTLSSVEFKLFLNFFICQNSLLEATRFREEYFEVFKVDESRNEENSRKHQT